MEIEIEYYVFTGFEKKTCSGLNPEVDLEVELDFFHLFLIKKRFFFMKIWKKCIRWYILYDNKKSSMEWSNEKINCQYCDNFNLETCITKRNCGKINFIIAKE